jgi:hypothetical protein
MSVLEMWRMEMKADAVALLHFVQYSEEEALRLGVSGVVIEFLRMARIELTNTIEKGGLGGSADAAEAVRKNDRQRRGIGHRNTGDLTDRMFPVENRQRRRSKC